MTKRELELLQILKDARREFEKLQNEAASHLQMDIIEKETKQFNCPHCQTELRFTTAVQIKNVKKVPSQEVNNVLHCQDSVEPVKPIVAPKSPIKKLSPQEQELISQVEGFGIIEAFQYAYEQCDTHPTPKNIYKSFVSFLRTATLWDLPPYDLRKLLPNDMVCASVAAYRNTAGITCILGDGEFKAFVPTKLIQRKRIKPLTSNLQNQAITPEDWVRTKNGYVLGSSVMFHELIGRTAGSFATASA